MAFRIKACAAMAAVTGALFTPAALASPGISHAPVQVTGKQLKNGLLPPSHLLPGYVTLSSGNSGGSLEHGASRRIPPMDCFVYLASIGVDKGYGETAFADQMAAAKSASPFITQEIFQQAVYQFAGSRAASSFFGQISAKFRTCKVVITKDTKGGTLKQVVHARSALRVGGHQSLQIVEYLTDSKTPEPGTPLVTYWLFTVDGTNVYIINSVLGNVHAPKPTLSSLMLKLIPRVRALR
jgi:hypothetical protein